MEPLEFNLKGTVIQTLKIEMELCIQTDMKLGIHFKNTYLIESRFSFSKCSA